MEYPNTRLFSSKMSVITTASPRDTTFSDHKKHVITKRNNPEYLEKSLQILFDKNIALENLDYLDYDIPDDEEQSFSQFSSSNFENNSFLSNSNHELLDLY